MNNMKTAMQELIEELESIKVYKYKNLVIALVKNKLEKEKEQIIEAWNDSKISMMNGNQYYNETYNQNK